MSIVKISTSMIPNLLNEEESVASVRISPVRSLTIGIHELYRKIQEGPKQYSENQSFIVKQQNPKIIHLPNASIFLHSLLGKGAYGSVFSGEYVSSECPRGLQVAIKINEIKSSCIRLSLETEAHILSKITAHSLFDLPVAKYIDSGSINPKQHLLVTELCELNVRQYLEQRRSHRMSLSEIQKTTASLLHGLIFLQNRNIIHADLKPQNLMINPRNGEIKIIDFGLAKEDYDFNLKGSYIVTRYYRPPEIVFGMPYDCRLDHFSFACIVYELATNRILFPANNVKELVLMHLSIMGPIPLSFNKKIPSYLLIEERFNRKREFYHFLHAEQMIASNQDLELGVIKEKVGWLREFLLQFLVWEPEKRASIELSMWHQFLF